MTFYCFLFWEPEFPSPIEVFLTARNETSGRCYKTFFDENTSLLAYPQSKSQGNTPLVAEIMPQKVL
jgi:hypothetical protein